MLYRYAKYTILVISVTMLLKAVIAEDFYSVNQTNITESNLADATRQLRSLRLPNTTYPLSYQLHITTNIHMADFRFNGNVTIDIEIRVTTNEIVLHAKNLTDFKITVRSLDTKEILNDLTYTYLSYASFLIIHPVESYQAFELGQHYRLEILYTGVMQETTKGLYWMAYDSAATNQTVYIAATQSEPTYARLLFPCYDEPAFKSNFTIKLTHGSNYMAISNMPVKSKQPHGNSKLTTTTFYATLPMSTYLVAFVISDFEYISGEYRGITQRIFTPHGSTNNGQQALKNAILTVAALEDYFGIKYPLAKLDHIALKKNYGAAMENWGLITYKGDNLAFSDDGDMNKKLKDMLTQSHEIAHQWFGNLVSPEWWTYAWLNEGFATYFSYVILDLIYPKEKIMEFFLTDAAERAYNYVAVRPMTHYVETESEIMSVFDIISYQRAACVIKMFHHAFNQKTFVRGISQFFQKFQYSVVNELQLFDTLQAVVKEDPKFHKKIWIDSVQDIMLSWTHSKWLPVLSVIRNSEAGTITFRQRSKNRNSYENWWIPINFATTKIPDFDSTYADYFMPPLTELTLPLTQLGLQLSTQDWLIVNKQQTGFYHVLYDINNLRAIAKQLQSNHSVIHSINRAVLFQDLAPLIEHNEIESVDVIFELLKYLEHENELMPWSLVADTVHFLERNLFGTASHEHFKRFIRRLISPIFHRLFAKPEPANLTNGDVLARQKVLEMACLADLKDCLEYTHKLAHEYIFKGNKLQTDMDYYAMCDTVLCLGVRYLSDDEFNGVINLLLKSDRNSLYHDDLIYSLRCTQDHAHLHQYLNVLLGENSTHLIMNDKESMMYILYMYKSNMIARPVVWHFFERNYKLLCRSPFFVENFNRIAEYMPERHRDHFLMLRYNIGKELEAMGNDAAVTLIGPDSKRFGKKIRQSELFLETFEHQIYDWLLADNPQINFASPLGGVHSGSERLDSILTLVSILLKKVVQIAL